ncbi:MAG: hypothetical protein DCC71_17475 [Proteobacteria bacterium]|nr:MAG: hypothetical protein DCC71_17475 [Pseudomonadota bacterium]
MLVLSISVAFATTAAAAPDGRPARPKSIGLWSYHDPDPVYTSNGYEPWTPSDVVGFLGRYPDAYVDVAWGDGKAPGLLSTVRLRELVNEAQSIAKQRGVNVDRRLCLSNRPDVFTRLGDTLSSCHPSRGGGGCDWEGNMDGRFGESETVVKTSGAATDGDPTHLVDTSASWVPELYRHRLVVLRPGAGEERRRITANDASILSVDAPWSTPPSPGDRYEIRGSFDPAWIVRVPRSVHQSTMSRFWDGARQTACRNGPCPPPPEPLDPFASANKRGWENWVNRTFIQSLATPTSVPALYGYAYDGTKSVDYYDAGHVWTDPYFRATAVIMDLANPAYRAWQQRYLMYKIQEFGFEPSEPLCLLVTYKPGSHTFHDEATFGPSNIRCAASGTNNWWGPTHVCSDGAAQSGPMHPTQYRRGEFENAISAYFRELFSALSAARRGDTRVITGEAPPYGVQNWSVFAEDVRRHPMMREEQGGWIEPKLAELRASEPAEEPPSTGPPSEPPAEPTPSEPPAQTPPETPPAEAPPAETPPTETGGGGGMAPGGDGPGESPGTGWEPAPVDHGTSGSPVPRSSPRSPSGGSPPAAPAPSSERAERRGYMTSGGSGGASGTVEAPGAE